MRRRNKKKSAPAAVHFTTATNNAGQTQICVYARCLFSERQVGPVWGHAEPSVRRALAELTSECDCPARFHSAREFSGHRVTGPAGPAAGAK
jgi:hypothetical protein